MKTCTKCGEAKPLEEFNIARNKKGGHCSACKMCTRIAANAYYAANKERSALTGKAWREKNKERKKATNKAWYESNKERVSLLGRVWRSENESRKSATNKAWLDSNKERRSVTIKLWREANPDRGPVADKKWYEANRERGIANSTAWRKANPEKSNARTSRRRGAKLNATPAWADKEKITEFYVLAGESTRKTGVEHHVDHVVPLRSKRVCGLHCEANLQVISSSENMRKGNRYWPDMP